MSAVGDEFDQFMNQMLAPEPPAAPPAVTEPDNESADEETTPPPKPKRMRKIAPAAPRKAKVCCI